MGSIFRKHISINRDCLPDTKKVNIDSTYYLFMDLSAIEENGAYDGTLYDIYDDIDAVKRIKIQCLRWLGYIARSYG